MNDKMVAAISELMAAVTTLSGLSVLWKDAAGGSEPELPLEQCRHCNPFCAAVKASPVRMRRCSLNDSQVIARQIAEPARPFINRCHAGVDELIVPIFSGGVYSGAFFLGPFRRLDAVCRYPAGRRGFASVPVYDPERIAAAGRLLRLLELTLAEQRQVLAIRREADAVAAARLRPALDYIDRFYARPLTAAEVAGRCHLSVSRFLHVFKAQCGTGFSNYLIRRRLEEAKLLLASTELNIGELALRCGFSSQSYFGLAFRRLTGSTPALWRQSRRRPQEP